MFDAITVSITYYNSFKFIQDAIYLPLIDDRVREIVIYDDGSSRPESKSLEKLIDNLKKGKPLDVYLARKHGYADDEEYSTSEYDLPTIKKIQSHFSVPVGANWKKIKLVQAKKNLGSYVAKYEAVKNSTSDWTLLLDSDNHLIESSIDGIFSTKNPRDDEMLVPNVSMMNRSGAYPWDYWNFRKFGYSPMNLSHIRKLFNLAEFGDDTVSHLLNNGNMLMNTENYVSASAKGMMFKDLVSAKESCLLYASWLSMGLNIRVVPGFIYFHRLHGESLWMVKLDEHKPTDIEILNYFQN